MDFGTRLHVLREGRKGEEGRQAGAASYSKFESSSSPASYPEQLHALGASGRDIAFRPAYNQPYLINQPYPDCSTVKIQYIAELVGVSHTSVTNRTNRNSILLQHQQLLKVLQDALITQTDHFIACTPGRHRLGGGRDHRQLLDYLVYLLLYLVPAVRQPRHQCLQQQIILLSLT
jgi:hypothetical protein